MGRSSSDRTPGTAEDRAPRRAVLVLVATAVVVVGASVAGCGDPSDDTGAPITSRLVPASSTATSTGSQGSSSTTTGPPATSDAPPTSTPAPTATAEETTTTEGSPTTDDEPTTTTEAETTSTTITTTSTTTTTTTTSTTDVDTTPPTSGPTSTTRGPSSRPPTSAPPTQTSEEPTTTGGGPTTTTSGPPTSGPVDVAEQLRTCEQTIRTARVVFAPMQTMVVGEVATVTVRASIEAEPPELDDPVPTTVQEIAVHCVLWARLRGGSFEIAPSEYVERSFLEQSTVQWTWHVEPEETGDLALILEVQSRVDDSPGLTKEFETRIRVRAEPRSVVETVNDTASGLVTHPVVAFVGLTGLAGGAALGARLRRSRAGGPPDARGSGSV